MTKRISRQAATAADADGKAHAGGGPKAGGGGEALDLVAAGDDDGAGAQKADAVDDLGPQTGGVAVAEDLNHILVGEDGEGGAHADQHVGPKAGGAPLASPLDADDAAAEDGKTEAQQNRKPIYLPDKVEPLSRILQAKHKNNLSLCGELPPY